MRKDNGRILYEAMDGISEKWIALADEPMAAKQDRKHFVAMS